MDGLDCLERIYAQPINSVGPRKGETREKVKQLNYIVSINYWLLRKGETSSSESMDFSLRPLRCFTLINSAPAGFRDFSPAALRAAGCEVADKSKL